jgi:hypothetical protein
MPARRAAALISSLTASTRIGAPAGARNKFTNTKSLLAAAGTLIRSNSQVSNACTVTKSSGTARWRRDLAIAPFGLSSRRTTCRCGRTARPPRPGAARPGPSAARSACPWPSGMPGAQRRCHRPQPGLRPGAPPRAAHRYQTPPGQRAPATARSRPASPGPSGRTTARTTRSSGRSSWSLTPPTSYDRLRTPGDRTQWARFSIPRCPWTHAAGTAGGAARWPAEVIT